jgi:hypothetical protein
MRRILAGKLPSNCTQVEELIEPNRGVPLDDRRNAYERLLSVCGLRVGVSQIGRQRSKPLRRHIAPGASGCSRRRPWRTC